MSKKRKNRKTGLPPGTLIYTGDAQTDNSNVVVIQYNETSISEHILRGGDECPLGQEDKVTWYDVKGINNVKMIERIGQLFQIHPLALEDVLNTQQRPKWEDYQNGIFLIVRSQRTGSETLDITTEQVAFFFSKNFIITFQEDEEDLFHSIRDRLHQGLGKLRQKGVDYLAYTLLDYIVDNYFIILDKTEESIENLENKILNDFKSTTRNEIYNLKRQQSEIRRAVLPLREVIGRFAREDGKFVEQSNLVYIRDLYDHLTQIAEMIESQRDMLQNLNDLFNAEQSIRANHVMKVLTIVSSIFIPLTFIVGVYGMNFDNLPELHFQNGYFAVWILMIFIAILQLIYFRIKKWL
jgi:magnesium transporter